MDWKSHPGGVAILSVVSCYRNQAEPGTGTVVGLVKPVDNGILLAAYRKCVVLEDRK